MQQDCFLLLGEVLYFPAPFPECLHTSHLIKNELQFKGQLRNHLPHEGIYNSWARKSSRHLFSACIAFLASINSKCVLSHLFWELEALRSGSCLLLCLLGHWGQCYLCSEMHGVYLLGVCVSSVICLCSVAQSYLTLCDPMDCSPPCSSVHGIFQVRILEWVAISYPRGPSWIRDRTHIFCVSWTGRQILYPCATWEAQVFV